MHDWAVAVSKLHLFAVFIMFLLSWQVQINLAVLMKNTAAIFTKNTHD